MMRRPPEYRSPEAPQVGGSENEDVPFRDAAARLYEEAYASHQAESAEAVKRPVAPFNVLIWIGVFLICLEALSLGFIYGARRSQLTSLTPKPNPLLRQSDCRGEVYRTYRKIIAYQKDHGRLPGSLDELLGKYSAMLPTDPETGQPLLYSVHGAQLVLRCPEGSSGDLRPPGDSV